MSDHVLSQVRGEVFPVHLSIATCITKLALHVGQRTLGGDVFFQVLILQVFGPTRVRTLRRSALAHRGVVSDDISISGLIFLTQRAGKGSLCTL